MLEGKGYC